MDFIARFAMALDAGAYKLSEKMGRYSDLMEGAQPTKLEPRALKSKILADPLVPQNLTTANAAVDPNLDKRLREIINKSKEHEVMGIDLGENCEFIDGRPFDLAIMPTAELVSTGYEGLIENKPMMLYSLNGQRIPNPERLSDEAWQDQWRVPGAAAVPYTWGQGKDTPPSGGTYYIGGSYSIHGYSTDYVLPGDKVGARQYSHRPEVRQREMEMLKKATNENHPYGRLEPILFRARPEGAMRRVHNALAGSFRRANQTGRDLSRILDAMTYERESEANRIALSLRLDATYKAFAFMLTLADAGLITINAPQATNMAELMARYNQRADLENADANALANNITRVNPVDGTGISRAPAPNSTEMREKLYGQMWLAAKLGLYRDPQNSMALPPAERVIEASIARSYRPLIADADVQNGGDIRWAIPATPARSQIPVPDGLGHEYNTASFAGQMSNAQMYAATASCMAIIHSRERYQSSIVFEAIGRGGPGELWDVVQKQ